MALVALGSLGRGELTPASDLDLLLLHRNHADITRVAERIWYPVWDAGVALDHSVRTPEQAATAARDDLLVMLGLLDARHIAGDTSLSVGLRDGHLRLWRAQADRRLPELAASCGERAARSGELAFLLEPDLKAARGGLRDAQALWQIAATQRIDRPTPAVAASKELLLDVRGELQRTRRVDRLTLQEQDGIAERLGYDDADALMLAVSSAGRAVAYALDVAWRQALPAASSARRGRFGRRGPTREPLAEGVVAQAGEVVLALDAAPETDSVLPLRVAAAAARASLPVAPHTLARLAKCPRLQVPWPVAALEALVQVLAAGPAAVPVLEAFDQADLFVPLLPEWEHTRSRPQRNAYHRFTVDRHLLETAAQAAQLTRRVARPDLLLLGALLHDIGKGRGADHTEAGMQLVGRIGPRLGLAPDDTEVLVRLVSQHLLLADVAQRRDLDDPATIAAVADAVGDRDTLDLLTALTEADSLATGPAAWSPWKERLLQTLVGRVRAVLGGSSPLPPALSCTQAQLLAARELALVANGAEIDVACPDRPGLLATVSGVLALHRLEIRSLTSTVADGWSLVAVLAYPRFGAGPDWSLVRADLARAVEDPAPLSARIAARAAAYPAGIHAQPPEVSWIDADVSAPVLQVRAPDGLGVLHRIAAAVTASGGVVLSARCQTLGADVVDTFSIKPLDRGARLAVGDAVLAALG